MAQGERAGPGSDRPRGRRREREREERDSGGIVDKLVHINRVAKVVKGGRRFSFTALVVVGDEVDRVGVGYGKAREVPLAITKAVEDAKKNMFTIPKHGSTITHEVLGRFDAARVMLRPASEGTGVIAGGGVRAVLELGGVRNVLAKSLGTTNPINMAKATVVALRSLRRPEDVARIRGKQISEVLPLPKIGKPTPEEKAAAAPPVKETPKPRKPATAKPKAAAKPKPEAVEVAPPVEEVPAAPVVEEPAAAAEPVAEEKPKPGFNLSIFSRIAFATADSSSGGNRGVARSGRSII